VLTEGAGVLVVDGAPGWLGWDNRPIVIDGKLLLNESAYWQINL
jgi:hypothetical protein